MGALHWNYWGAQSTQWDWVIIPVVSQLSTTDVIPVFYDGFVTPRTSTEERGWHALARLNVVSVRIGMYRRSSLDVAKAHRIVGDRFRKMELNR